MINRPNVLFYAQREDGPLKSKSEKYAKEQQIYTDFAGGLLADCITKKWLVC